MESFSYSFGQYLLISTSSDEFFFLFRSSRSNNQNFPTMKLKYFNENLKDDELK